MEIFLYEVVFEVAAEDAQSGGDELVRSERQTLQNT